MPRRRSRHTEKDVERVILMRDEGMPWTDIAQELNLSIEGCQRAHAEGTDTKIGKPKGVNRLAQTYERIVDMAMETANSIDLDQVYQLPLTERADVLKQLVGQIPQLQKVLGDIEPKNHIEEAPRIQQLLSENIEGLERLADTARRLRAKRDQAKEAVS